MGDSTEPAIPACPVDFSARTGVRSDRETLLHHLHAEFRAMHSWHTIASSQSGRTTAGLSGLSPGDLLDLFEHFLVDGDSGQAEAETATLLRLAAEDLKTIYFEALSAQPGQPTEARALSDWFWSTTYAAAVINEVRLACLQRRSTEMQLAGKLLLVPRNQLHRFEASS